MWKASPAIALALSGVAAIPSHLVGRNQCQFDSVKSPECWGDYSLSTNWYENTPDTGVTREYWFEVQNSTVAPDGVERIGLSINGSIPGPTIIADWGDTIVVHVHNAMPDNGTAIHFHGIHQKKTTQQDGVPGVTQCPVAPGESITYTWRAEQYGTTWYHSHFGLQAYNGIFGGILINGPASAPYHEDKGTITLNDWHHDTADQLFHIVSQDAPPAPKNGLINGTNVYGDGGERFTTGFERGKSYRLRLINGAMDNHMRFSIDGHKLQVIAADMVPIVPYETTTINMGIGQRYDVIVKADQEPGNYWMRAIPQEPCSENEMAMNITGIVRYGDSDALPTTDMWPFEHNCNDENIDQIVPYVKVDAEVPAIQEKLDVKLEDPGDGWYKWYINGDHFVTNWNHPSIQRVVEGNSTFADTEHVIYLNESLSMVYVVIESSDDDPHPIHLHGHDSFVLGSGANSAYPGAANLTLQNPPRRDVVILPSYGWLVLGFRTDNPGIWLMHCHVGWHASSGFALQFIERLSEIGATVDADVLDSTCPPWNDYAAAKNITPDHESGI